ncbi:MAG: hypothetical protein AAFQ87_20270 [Bacteroidota bacterium]
MWQQTKRNFFFLFLILFLGLSAGNAQNIKATAEVDSLAVMIGSPIQLSLSVEHLSELELTLPEYQVGGKIGDLEIISLGERQISTVGNYQRSKLQMQITRFDSGYVYLPSQQIIATQPNDGQKIAANTDSILLRFHFPVVDTTQAYKPIKDIYDVPIGLADIWPWAAGAVALGLIAFGLFWLIRRLTRKEQIAPPPPPPLPAHEIAMRKLSELEAEQLWQSGKAREYYFELSYILREYIEGRFGVPALESTTDDILRDLKPKLTSDQCTHAEYRIVQNSIRGPCHFARAVLPPIQRVCAWRSHEQAKVAVGEARFALYV